MENVSCFVECELIKRIKGSQDLNTQVDESNDVGDISVLHTIEIHIHNIKLKNRCTWARLPAHNIGEDTFNPIHLYIAEEDLDKKWHTQMTHNPWLREQVALLRMLKPLHQ
jgi:hypothetical protein